MPKNSGKCRILKWGFRFAEELQVFGSARKLRAKQVDVVLATSIKTRHPAAITELITHV